MAYQGLAMPARDCAKLFRVIEKFALKRADFPVKRGIAAKSPRFQQPIKSPLGIEESPLDGPDLKPRADRSKHPFSIAPLEIHRH